MHIRRERRSFFAVVTVLSLIASVCTSLFVLQGNDSATAADRANFDPGYIISDANFFNASSMNATDVQNLLNAKVPRCTLGDAGKPAGGIYTWPNGSQIQLASTCLKDYTESIPTLGADRYCQAVSGGSFSAASLIVKVGQACGISPKVLVVLLEKEQYLISDSWPAQNQYTYATGFNCPDTAPCSAASGGFFKQVYAAARQFQVYTQNPGSFNYRPGNNTIQYHPNPACGTANVYIANQATANLYIYTPYVPNGAAMANLYGEGDTCSAYGNRNFWRMYTDWFGSPTVDLSPRGSVDQMSAVSRGVNIFGWIIDPDATSVDYHVYSNGRFVYGGTANNYRPDVASVFGTTGNQGFNAYIPLPSGVNRVCVYGINVGYGQNKEIGCNTLVVDVAATRGYLDNITTSGTGITLQGWAFEPGSTGAANVHVYVDGKFAAGFATDSTRTDVKAAYPQQSTSTGFYKYIAEPQGIHKVCVYALNTTAENALELGCRTVDVSLPQPMGYLDFITGGAGSVSMTGWAFEPGNQNPVSVHVYVDGAFAKGFMATATRTDVKSVFPAQSANHGISETVPVARAGSHQVCAYAQNTAFSKPLALGCRTVTTS